MTFKKFKYVYIKGLSDDLRNDLTNTYHIDELDIEDVFTDTQLSKIELKEGYLYVALQFPEYINNEHHFFVKKLHCFIQHDRLVIINENDYKIAEEFNNEIDNLMGKDTSSQHVFYELLDYCITSLMKTITTLRQEINVIDEEVFLEEIERDLILEIQILKRNLINFQSVIHPLEENIEDLMNKFNPFIDAFGMEKLDDSLDKIKKIINNVSNFKEQMNMITETNEALIARSTNKTIKVLTSVNIIFLIPTLIASVFGMNLSLGFGGATLNILEIIFVFLLMTLLTFWAYIAFKRKGWL